MLPSDFPSHPPKGYFITKIFHPNVSKKGEICVNTLKKDWDPRRWSLGNILQVTVYLESMFRVLGNKMSANCTVS